MTLLRMSFVLLGASVLLGCSVQAQTPDSLPTPKPAARESSVTLVKSSSDIEAAAPLAEATGEATYYADKFEGRRTASGIVFSNAQPYAAHREYPFGTIVRVTNLKNDRSVILRIVDRGPNGSIENQRRTIIDISRSAARELDLVRFGRLPVKVEVLEWGSRK